MILLASSCTEDAHEGEAEAEGEAEGETDGTRTVLTSSALRREGGRRYGASTGLSEVVHPCPTGSHTCLTPTAVSGQAFQVAIRISYSETYIRLVPVGTMGFDKSYDFDFAEPPPMLGDISCCDGHEFGAHVASFKDAEIFFAYLDVTVDAFSVGVADPHTFRLVYADDSDDYCDAAMTFVGSSLCPLGGGDCKDTDPAVYPGSGC